MRHGTAMPWHGMAWLILQIGKLLNRRANHNTLYSPQHLSTLSWWTNRQILTSILLLYSFPFYLFTSSSRRRCRFPSQSKHFPTSTFYRSDHFFLRLIYYYLIFYPISISKIFQSALEYVEDIWLRSRLVWYFFFRIRCFGLGWNKNNDFVRWCTQLEW